MSKKTTKPAKPAAAKASSGKKANPIHDAISAVRAAYAELSSAREALIEQLIEQFRQDKSLNLSAFQDWFPMIEEIGEHGFMIDLAQAIAIELKGSAAATYVVHADGTQEPRMINVSAKLGAAVDTDDDQGGQEPEADTTVIAYQFEDEAEANLAMEALAEEIGDDANDYVDTYAMDDTILMVAASVETDAKKVFARLKKEKQISSFSVVELDDTDDGEEDDTPKKSGKKGSATDKDEWGTEGDEDESPATPPKKPAKAAAAPAKKEKSAADPAVVKAFTNLLTYLKSLPGNNKKDGKARDAAIDKLIDGGFDTKAKVKAAMKAIDSDTIWYACAGIDEGKVSTKAQKLWTALEEAVE